MKNNNFKPAISNNELNKISEAQAKLIYDEAKNFIKDHHDSLVSLTGKADMLFKYLFTIQSSLCALYFWQVKNLAERIDYLPAIFVLFCLPMMIYSFSFLSPIKTKGIFSPPIDTITKRATLDLAKFYLFEAIDIQRFSIPYNLQCLSRLALSLRLMVSSSILAILFFISALFWS